MGQALAGFLADNAANYTQDANLENDISKFNTNSNSNSNDIEKLQKNPFSSENVQNNLLEAYKKFKAQSDYKNYFKEGGTNG